MKLPVYLDYHATTPVDPRVLEAMRRTSREVFGNAGLARATCSAGRRRRRWTRRATRSPRRSAPRDKEIVFTSGATESDNLAILGVARLLAREGRHVVTAATEHRAVLDSCRALEREGFEVTLPRSGPDRARSPPEQVREALTDRTILVSLMLANNEIGTIQPIPEIGAVCRERGVLFHTDAVQGFGEDPVRRRGGMRVDLASITAHKIYGPKGVGRALRAGAATRACVSRRSSTAAATSAACGRAR